MTSTDTALAAGTAIHRDWGTACHHAIRTLAARGRPFTAEDVRALALLEWHQPGQLGLDGTVHTERPSHNILPAAMHVAAQQHQIRVVGYRPATRRARKGGLLRIWTGTNHTHQES